MASDDDDGDEFGKTKSQQMCAYKCCKKCSVKSTTCVKCGAVYHNGCAAKYRVSAIDSTRNVCCSSSEVTNTSLASPSNASLLSPFNWPNENSAEKHNEMDALKKENVLLRELHKSVVSELQTQKENNKLLYEIIELLKKNTGAPSRKQRPELSITVPQSLQAESVNKNVMASSANVPQNANNMENNHMVNNVVAPLAETTSYSSLLKQTSSNKNSNSAPSTKSQQVIRRINAMYVSTNTNITSAARLKLKTVQGRQFTWIFLSRLSPDNTEEDIMECLKEANPNCTTFECIKLIPKYENARFVSFKAKIPYELENTILDREFWPSGTLVKRFYFPKNDTSNNTALKSTEANQNTIPTPSQTNEDVLKIGTDFGLSTNTVVGVAAALRTSTKNRKLFEPYLKEKMQNLNHALDSYFTSKECKVICTEKKNKENIATETLVYCSNIDGLLKRIKNKRDVNETHLKFGIDGGGGFLKICLSVQKTNAIDGPKHRFSYKDSNATTKFKDSGVKKLFLLGIIANTKENYENVLMLWSLLNINKFNATIATDLKLANILTGIMSHSSCFPCTWCSAAKHQLGSCGEYRSLAICAAKYHAWKQSGSNKTRAKEFENCMHLPIIAKNDNTMIIDIIPPPELHLMLGVVNTLFNHMLKDFEIDALNWAKECNKCLSQESGWSELSRLPLCSPVKSISVAMEHRDKDDGTVV
ncbi:unnamed protein product [Brassicogethes aeneus]|uniref:Uncharacterized protein n=1 Tax=Brassicogethes aeneus TaxID=1431903 RepID=A0A9P0ATE7_BRAAE|nr:unnamed protein product [Brassicogethes aeneus]